VNACDSNQSLPLSQQETEALNRHGVFLKKRILHDLQEISGLGIVSEELGVSFGETRVIDIVCVDQRDKPHLLFAVECKRAYAVERRWIFFNDVHQRYRVLRQQSGLLGHSSIFAVRQPLHSHVCSEGYEYRKSEVRADQNPIFQAATQISAGYLGLIARRQNDFNRPVTPSDAVERYVPLMVTNAELVVVDQDLKATSMETGNMPAPPQAKSVDFLLLKHPFPTPGNMSRDLRDYPNPLPGPADWSQMHKESIYVVRASALKEFMGQDHRDYLRSAKSED
jgi:hypothetical protein